MKTPLPHSTDKTPLMEYPVSKGPLFLAQLPADAGKDPMTKLNRVERFFDRHNHTMAFVRTVFSIIAGIASSIVLLKMSHLL